MRMKIIIYEIIKKYENEMIIYENKNDNVCLDLHKLTCYIKNIRDITMDNKLTTVPDDAATRETNPKKIKCLISPLWVPL